MFRFRLYQENRENDGDEEIDLVREVTEKKENTSRNRNVLDDRLFNVEAELHGDAEPGRAGNHRRASALQSVRLQYLARGLRFALHLGFLHRCESGSSL